MATQRLQLVSYDDGRCTIAVIYDDVTLAASAVEASNSSPYPCAVTLSNGVVTVQGTLAVGAAVQHAIPAGALTLTPNVEFGLSLLDFAPWSLSTRWPA